MENRIQNNIAISENPEDEELSPYCGNCDADLRNEIIYVPQIMFAEVSLDNAGDLQFNFIEESCDDGHYQCCQCCHIVELDEDQIKQILKMEGDK